MLFSASSWGHDVKFPNTCKNQKTKNQKLSVHSTPSFFLFFLFYLFIFFLFIFERFLDVVVRNTFGFLVFWFFHGFLEEAPFKRLVKSYKLLHFKGNILKITPRGAYWIKPQTTNHKPQTINLTKKLKIVYKWRTWESNRGQKGLLGSISPMCTLSQNGYGTLFFFKLLRIKFKTMQT